MRRMNHALFTSLFAGAFALAALPAAAQATMKPQEVVRKEQGNRITENVPEIPAELVDEVGTPIPLMARRVEAVEQAVHCGQWRLRLMVEQRLAD